MSHRPARINPDSLGVLVVAVSITVILAAVSFLMSYSGLVAVAEWAAVPPSLSWAVPVVIDGAILVYTLAALIFRARGEGARLAWASLSLFTGLSVVGNAAHAWDAGAGDERAYLGSVIAGLAPVAVLLTTHTIARLIVAPPSGREAWEAVAPSVEAGLVEGLTAPVEWFAEPVPVPRPEPELVTRLKVSREEAPRPSRATVDTAARDARIRELDGTMSLRAIAAEVGVSKSTVARVLGRHPDEDTAPALALA
jgi:hypothetical protein